MQAEPTIQLVELDRAECLRLLAATNLGRLAVNAPGGLAPVIRPVNYVFDANSNSVVFRWPADPSSPASSCRDMRPSRLTASSRPARPVDVIVIGVAEEVQPLPTCSV